MIDFAEDLTFPAEVFVDVLIFFGFFFVDGFDGDLKFDEKKVKKLRVSVFLTKCEKKPKYKYSPSPH